MNASVYRTISISKHWTWITKLVLRRRWALRKIRNGSFSLLILPPSSALPFFAPLQAPRRLLDLEVSAAQQQVSLAWREKACSPRSCQEELLNRLANWERVCTNATPWGEKNKKKILFSCTHTFFCLFFPAISGIGKKFTSFFWGGDVNGTSLYARDDSGKYYVHLCFIFIASLGRNSPVSSRS